MGVSMVFTYDGLCQYAFPVDSFDKLLDAISGAACLPITFISIIINIRFMIHGAVLFMGSLFMGVLFMGVLFMEVLFMGSLFMGSLFMGSLFMALSSCALSSCMLLIIP